MGKILFCEPVFPHLNVKWPLFLDHFVPVSFFVFHMIRRVVFSTFASVDVKYSPLGCGVFHLEPMT